MTDMVEKVAWALCVYHGNDPEFLEPGDAYGVDGYRKGEPCHYLWRHYVRPARVAIQATREPTTAVANKMDEHAANSMVDWRELHEAFIDAALSTKEE